MKRTPYTHIIFALLLTLFVLAACTSTDDLQEVQVQPEELYTQATEDLYRRVWDSESDAEESESGVMNLTSSDLEMVDDNARGSQRVGLRFPLIDVPPGATVTQAWIQFTVDEPTSMDTTVGIRAINQDDAPLFSTSQKISGRAKTSAGVTWSIPPWEAKGDSGKAQRTPDLKAIVQEIVDRPGWESSNDISFVVAYGGGKRVAHSRDAGKDLAPLLYVQFETDASDSEPEPETQADYYVGKDGSDSDNSGTSPSQPFATLKKALSVVNPGETIQMRGGTYYAPKCDTESYPSDYIRSKDFITDGKRGNPITIENYPGEKVIIDGRNCRPSENKESDGTVIISNPKLFNLDADWYVIQGLTFQYGAGRAVFVQGNNNVLRDIISHSHHGDGIYNKGNYNTFERIESFNNYSEQNSGESADGIKMGDPATGNIIRHFRAYNNSDDGIDIFNSNNTTVEYSISYRNGRGKEGDGQGYKLGGRLGGDLMGDTNNVVMYSIAYKNKTHNFAYNSSNDIKMFGNTSWDADSDDNGNGSGFSFSRENIGECNLSYAGEEVSIGSSNVQQFQNSWNVSNPPVPNTTEGSSGFLSVGSRASVSTACNIDVNGQQISTSHIGALAPGKTLSEPPFNQLPPETCSRVDSRICGKDSDFWRPSGLR